MKKTRLDSTQTYIYLYNIVYVYTFIQGVTGQFDKLYNFFLLNILSSCFYDYYDALGLSLKFFLQHFTVKKNIIFNFNSDKN